MSGGFDLSSLTSSLGGGGGGAAGPVSKEFGRSSAEANLYGDTVNYGRGIGTDTLLLIAAVVTVAGLVWYSSRK